MDEIGKKKSFANGGKGKVWVAWKNIMQTLSLENDVIHKDLQEHRRGVNSQVWS